LKSNDIVFNWRNSVELVGKSSIFIQPYNDSRNYTFASFLLRLRCDEQKAHNHYFSLLFNFYREVGVFTGMARQAVNQANFNKTEVYDLQVPVPPYDLQVTIALELAELKQKKQLIAEQIENSVKLRNSIMDRILA
jgi:restriction endonuclease S subunit